MIRKLEGGQTEWGQFQRDMATSFLEPPYGRYDGPFEGIERIVIEDFVLYPPGVGDGPPPWWDQLITPRLIGAIQNIADLAGVPVDYQGAGIKSDALASAAAEDFSRPLYENRHENDATMHGTYYISRLLVKDGPIVAPFTLLAIDPGETVGWATFRFGS